MLYLRLGRSSDLHVLDPSTVESKEGENGPALYADPRDEKNPENWLYPLEIA
jgi:hypothetical protein